MFSESDRRNILVGTAAVILMTVACVAIVLFYKSRVPENIEGSTIDITESQLQEAMSKWRARNPSQYEMSLHSGQDDVTLLVNVNENTIEVLKHLHAGSPVTSELPPGSGSLRSLTVDLLFQNAQHGLANAAPSEGVPPTSASGTQTFLDYSFRFDPELGYPNYYAAYARTTKPSREVVWRDTLREPIEITSLKIIN